MTTTALPPLWNPNDELYTDLADLPHLMKIAWLEALADPDRADQIIADAVAAAKRVTQVASMHLKGSVERASRRESAATKATERAARTIAVALEGLVIQGDDYLNPHGFYVYLLWEAEGEVPIYVGKSTNILSRLGQHMTTHDRRHRTKRITVIRCKTDRQMDQTERRLIRHYRPELNIAGIS